MGWLKRMMNNPDVEAFGEDYKAIERYTGEHMAAWDTRSIPDAFPPEPPGVGYANDHVKATDPTWKGPR